MARRTSDVNILALIKGEERYIFLYDDRHASQVIHTMGSFAADYSLSFTWYDAAVCAQKVRREMKSARNGKRKG